MIIHPEEKEEKEEKGVEKGSERSLGSNGHYCLPSFMLFLYACFSPKAH